MQYVENAGIIAVNYVARAKGVTRHMREKEAKEVCPDIVCKKVPSKFNKADISKYREAGKRVANVFEKFTTMLERASIDEGDFITNIIPIPRSHKLLMFYSIFRHNRKCR